MNEKELQEITEKIERALYLYNPIPITTIKEIVDQLIAEVRKLRKPLIVSSTIKKLADENKLYKDLYTKVNTQNMVYKVALEKSEEALKEVMSWHGDNLQIANWHQNGALEP